MTYQRGYTVGLIPEPPGLSSDINFSLSAFRSPFEIAADALALSFNAN